MSPQPRSASATLPGGASLRRGLTIGAFSLAALAAGNVAAEAQESDDATYDVEFATERLVEADDDIHVVSSGEYLSTIAVQYGLGESDWHILFDANDSIEHPDLIFPGDEIRIPEEGETLERRDPPAGTAAASSSSSTASSSSSTSSTSAPQESAPEPTPAPTTSQSRSAPATTQSESANAGVWDRIAQCESGGDWSINTGNGYYGGVQFALSSWQWVGGSGYPHEASKAEQIRRAEILLDRQGWAAWPACSSKLGLR